MSRCIYCLKNSDQVNFTKREHVIPSLLGSFSPVNPTIKANYGLVCDACNEKFNKLETLFSGDTPEGVFAQRLDTGKKKYSVTILDNYYKAENLSDNGDFFNEIFYFIKLQNGKFVYDSKDQVKLKMRQGGYRVFLLEGLKQIKEGSYDFGKIKKDFGKLNQEDIRIFADSQKGKNDIIALIEKFGVAYGEKMLIKKPSKPGGSLMRERWNFKIGGDVKKDKDPRRVLAKIAFNYFAYCAFREGKASILFDSHFDPIREFVCSGDGDLRGIIPSSREEPFLEQEIDTGKRFVGHIINFSNENNFIVTRATFFGMPMIYKIIIGAIPRELDNIFFGCGHAFNPFTHKIGYLTQITIKNSSVKQNIQDSFGLFRRNT